MCACVRACVRTRIVHGRVALCVRAWQVERIVDEMPTASVIESFMVEDFAHLDFTWAPDAAYLVYPHVLSHLG